MHCVYVHVYICVCMCASTVCVCRCMCLYVCVQVQMHTVYMCLEARCLLECHILGDIQRSFIEVRSSTGQELTKQTRLACQPQGSSYLYTGFMIYVPLPGLCLDMRSRSQSQVPMLGQQALYPPSSLLGRSPVVFIVKKALWTVSSRQLCPNITHLNLPLLLCCVFQCCLVLFVLKQGLDIWFGLRLLGLTNLLASASPVV